MDQLQGWTKKPICPDTEGAQIRSALLCENLNVNNHEVVTFVNSASHINPKEIGITGGFVDRLFSCGDLIKIDFNGVLIQIIESNNADSPLKNAPHTALYLASDNWAYSYSRNLAAYPSDHQKAHKYWPPVGRIDNAFGDRNLICTCPSIDEYKD